MPDPATRADLPIPGHPEAAAGLVQRGVLDAELAALLWLLAEARTPHVVVGEPGDARDTVLEAVAGLLPSGARMAVVAPDDDFEWLPEAVELGWRRERGHLEPVRDADPRGRLGPGDGVLVARDLGAEDGIAGVRARVVVRALALGYGMLATMAGDALDDAISTLHAPAIGTSADERSRLGVVLALEKGATAPRIGAAHYVRPVALDTHGHVQRLAPAVLATWRSTSGRWDHFAWGALADLAGLTGMRPVDFEREQARRSALLAGLAASL